ncbi:MAG: hypothetical protein K0Q43_60 [Ramlibacter sp.]|jgi:hypothetical protein|nr:hypothetical protein [Ramlibacter sp.]
MPQAVDYTHELLQLMKFAGLTATAIRMYSAYNPQGYESGFFGARHADPARSPVDLMFLADAVHHFERLGLDIESGDTGRIIESCDHLLKTFSDYQVETPQFASQAKPAFELWGHLVKLDDAKDAFLRIRNKAVATPSAQPPA